MEVALPIYITLLVSGIREGCGGSVVEKGKWAKLDDVSRFRERNYSDE